VLKGLESRDAGPGEEIFGGERIKTGKEATATILYADGSKVVIKPESEFQVEENVKGTQWNRLRSGQVRGVIQKTEGSSEGSAPARPRFLIRSKTAVMGVRGTDFVMALGKGMASVHTLEGAVEVAKTEAAVLGGQGTAVGAGQMVEATSSGITAPKPFNTEQFLKSFESGSSAAPGSGAASGAAQGAGGAAPGAPSATSASPAEIPSAPPPTLAPPPQLPPEQQKQVDAAEAKKAEEEKRKIRLAAFRAAALFLRPPESDPLRLFAFSWIPSIPIPFLPIEVRGQAGGAFYRDGSLNSTALMHEYHLFAGTALWKKLLLEVGFGWQFWRSDNWAGRAVTVNFGYIFSPNGFFNHIYVGRSLLYPFRREEITIHETRVGIGLIAF
jgi:hypothetical protein